MENMIEVKGIELPELIKRAYAFSDPQGLGHLHFQDGGLSDKDTQSIMDNVPEHKDFNEPRLVASMDYVHGRSCKFGVWRKGDTLYVRDQWYDHSPDQLTELLTLDRKDVSMD